MSALHHVFIILVAVISYLIFGPNSDIVAYGSFEKGGPVRIDGGRMETEEFLRTNVYFPNVEGTSLHGWYYRPAKYFDEKLPVVLMASGLGAQIDFGMQRYAEFFVKEANYAVLLFDYRGFGSSDGKIRNLVDPDKHIEDWKSAMQYLHSKPKPGKIGVRGVDLNKIALWGTSMAGGHVLKLSSELNHKSIRAVISQSPHLDGRENRKKNMKSPPEGRGLIGSLRILRTSLQDIVRSLLNLPPAYIPIVGPLNTVALMPLPDEEIELYYEKHPSGEKGGGWLNRAPARIAAKVGFYSPIDFVPNITSPVLFVAAQQDTLCPLALIEKAHSLCSNKCELSIQQSGHFGLYSGEPFKEASKDMLKFLKKHLGVAPPPQDSNSRRSWEDRERYD